MSCSHPFAQLFLGVREFYREPEAVFWVYGFPVLLLAVGLGIASPAASPMQGHGRCSDGRPMPPPNGSQPRCTAN